MKIKALIVTVMCWLLVGCGNWVTEASMLNAIKLCETNGGLKHISIFTLDKAVCNNGAVYQRNAWFISD